VKTVLICVKRAIAANRGVNNIGNIAFFPLAIGGARVVNQDNVYIEPRIFVSELDAGYNIIKSKTLTTKEI